MGYSKCIFGAMSNGNKRVVVVTGLMRSGTSAIMQCLQAAGIRCLGNAPGYEDPRTVDEGFLPTELMLDAQGGAVKILEPHCRFLPSGFEYVVIATVRDKRQQARSYLKMIKAVGNTTRMSDIKATRRLGRMLHAHQRRADAIIDMLDCSVYRISFENLVGNPRDALEPLAKELSLDMDRLSSPIRDRPAQCLKGLLEIELMNGSRTPTTPA